LNPRPVGPSTHSARVLVRKVADLPAAVSEALDFLGYDFSGRKVWVKPNLLSPHPPAHSVTTDPELIRCCVRDLKARGTATVWVADNPGGGLQGNIASYLEPTGAIEASEGCFHNIGETPVPLKLNSRIVPEVHVSRILFDCDVILNLPVLKTHGLTIITGAIKNLFGIIPGAQKGTLHTLAPAPSRFAELLVDIYQAVPRPVLTVMDALRGMDGQNGPAGGRALAVGKLITGANPVAVDAVSCRMAGIEPELVPTVRIAAERGLGPIAASDIGLEGDFERIPGFRLPFARLPDTMLPAIAGVYRITRRFPYLKARLCTECRRCADNCPVKAIAMRPLPRIDHRACISCFCCAEICPTRAMVVPGLWRGLAGRIFGR